MSPSKVDISIVNVIYAYPFKGMPWFMVSILPPLEEI